MIVAPRDVDITHWHIFCGVGGGAQGFNQGEARVGHLRGRFVCLGGVDSDKGAIADFSARSGAPGTVLDLFSRAQYEQFHGAPPPAGWREATVGDIRRSAQGRRPNIVFGSAPCLPADGLVITSAGARPISTIREGDLVLSHRGRYQVVTAVGTERHVGGMYGIRLNGGVDRQWFTDAHPLWVRRVSRRGPGKKRHLGPAQFTPARDVRVDDRIGFPSVPARVGTAQEFIGQFGDPRLNSGTLGSGIDSRIADLREQADSAALWFLLGCYLGDGYRRRDGNGNVVSFCVGPSDGQCAGLVRGALDTLGLSYHVDASGGDTNVKIRVTSKHLHVICGAFGDGAECKRIPECLMSLEDHCLGDLIAGYRETDGSEQPRRRGRNVLQARWKIPSVSLQLLRDVQRLLLRRTIFASIHKVWPGGPQVIEGREVATRPRWELNVRLDPVKRTIHEFDSGIVWVRVRDIERRTSDEQVWNLSVEQDETFCGPMMATHNCKGFSGLLSEVQSKTRKYTALNQLAIRGLRLALEAWQDDPPEFWLWENVPRIQTRGAFILDEMRELLEQFNYATNPSTHDCGELGGLGQHRNRFLLVARHREKVPPFLYQPPKRRVRSVGEVLGAFPLPDDPASGPMHRMRMLHWKTWVRLAFVKAGGDWRSLKDLRVENGVLRDFALVPARAWHRTKLGVTPWDAPAGTVTAGGRPGQGAFSVADPRTPATSHGQLGVTDWHEPSGVVTGESWPTNGKFAVADPRIDGHAKSVQLGVRSFDDPAPTITGQMWPGQGPFAIADPRYEKFGEHYGKMRVEAFDKPAHTVTGSDRVGSGALSVADPRPGYPPGTHTNILRVTRFDEPGHTVTGAGHPAGGAQSVADPRLENGQGFGAYGVNQWSDSTGAIIGVRAPGQGRFSVADPRTPLDGSHTQLGVNGWDEPARVVSGKSSPTNGHFSVADPRLAGERPRFNNVYRVVAWVEASQAVTGGEGPSAGGQAVADPRPATSWGGKGKYVVTPFDEPANTVIAASATGNGAFAVADPRTNIDRKAGDAYLTSRNYGIVPWESPAGVVSGAACHDNGAYSVADPRAREVDPDQAQTLPAPTDRLVAIIQALDGTWHRPFTTLELAALQGLAEPDEYMELHGVSDTAWRERIGNAVPPPAAKAIASVIGQTLLLAMSGETFVLSNADIWVQPIALALSIDEDLSWQERT